MNIRRTSCQTTGISIDQIPHDGESGNTSRPFPVGDKSVVRSLYRRDVCVKDTRLSATNAGGFILSSMGMGKTSTEKNIILIALLAWLGIVAIVLATILGGCEPAWAEVTNTTASYYTKASCLREGTSGICANGEKLDDTKKTCASWDFKLGDRVRIINKRNGRSVVCVVTDRGPSKRLYHLNRKIDLSRAAFEEIEEISRGLALVEVKRIGK